MSQNVEQSAETRLALMELQMEHMRAQNTTLMGKVSGLENYIRERETERAKQERKQLMSALIFLGSCLTTIAAVIWQYRGVIFKG